MHAQEAESLILGYLSKKGMSHVRPRSEMDRALNRLGDESPLRKASWLIMEASKGETIDVTSLAKKLGEKLQDTIAPFDGGRKLDGDAFSGLMKGLATEVKKSLTAAVS